ncbi:hypothetical protein [Congregibacter litoralis]|uniref:Uncharacterized protein n=1 Tax=Congregibacter litoralis KT71 TaxID=314285 RepID=A4AC09_9GAMM|nr:hypothetical protein [Congregibacter litoralis]EAQ96459.2 hypothetical protein KT71_05527 [Congregibacter litoralis KT71]
MTIDFGELSLAPTGFIRTAVEHIPSGLASTTVRGFRKALELLDLGQKDDVTLRLKAVLESPLSMLTSHEIREFAGVAEKRFNEACAERSIKSTTHVERFLCLLRYAPGLLSNGVKVSQLGYLRARNQPIAPDSGGTPGMSDKAPVRSDPRKIRYESIRHDSEKELEEKAVELLEESRNAILATAREILHAQQDHKATLDNLAQKQMPNEEETVKSITSSKSKHFKLNIPPAVFAGSDGLAVTHSLARISHLIGLYKESFWLGVKDRPSTSIPTKGKLLCPPPLAMYLYQHKNSSLSALLSNHFMTPISIYAAVVILTEHTGWNPSSVWELTRSRVIEMTREGDVYMYKLQGHKGKTDQMLVGSDATTSIERTKNKLAFLAMSMLLENYESIRSNWGIKDDVLAVSIGFRHKHPIGIGFSAPGFSVTKIFRIMSGVEDFTLKNLRPLKATSEFLRTGNIYIVQGMLDHANISQTMAYIDGHIVARLAKANMARFMRHLESTIVFSIGKDVMPNKDGYDEDQVLENLFPIGDFTNPNQSIVGKWVASIDNSDEESQKIVVNERVIKYVAAKLNYYKKYNQALQARNPEAFVCYEVPQIVFCKAFQEFLKQKGVEV